MRKGKLVIIMRLIFAMAAVALLAGCSGGLPYVRNDGSLDVNQAKYGVIFDGYYYINYPEPVQEFAPAATSAIERSLIVAIKKSGGTAKVLTNQAFEPIKTALKNKAGATFMWDNSHLYTLKGVNNDTSIGDLKELFNKNDINAILLVSGLVRVKLPKMQNITKIDSIFYDASIDLNGTWDNEHLQLLVILPDGKIAFVSDLEQFSVLNLGNNHKARLLDEGMRNEMMKIVYGNFVTTFSAAR